MSPPADTGADDPLTQVASFHIVGGTSLPSSFRLHP
jgi:hypothetical protein